MPAGSCAGGCEDKAVGINMSILRFLGLQPEPPSSPETPSSEMGDTETVQRIVRELEALEPERARYLATFAYVLGRAANADSEISEEETQKMEEIVEKLGHVPRAQTILVVQIAKSQNRLFGSTENFLVTREFKEIATDTQRHELLDCVFAVLAADASITSVEESQARQIASELGFNHGEYVEARAAYSEHREVLKSFRKSQA